MKSRLLLYGAPATEAQGVEQAMVFERRHQLLAYLAIKRAWVGRAELASLLWPEQESRLAYSNLRKTLFRLQALPQGTTLDVQPGAVRFEVQTDVAGFDAALAEARLDDALALRRGPFLAGFDDDANEAWTNWLQFERERLDVAWRSAAMERLAGELEPRAAIALSASLLEADPLDEGALRLHMGWLERGGLGARAREAYREYEERVSRELGVAPSAQLRGQFEGLAARSESGAPAPALAAATLDEDFVGRAAEMRLIAERLSQEDCRLVTLAGLGGAGKTYLARRALGEHAPAHADGGAFIALEDVATPVELGSRVLRELGVSHAANRDPLDQAIEALEGRHMLLVLDNFEHLVAHAPLVERILRAGPRLRILVTSRVRLALPMEWVVPVDGMPSPDPEDGPCVDAFDATRLFVKAARRVNPAAAMGAEAEAVVEICRLVGGLPLAIKLAAAWTRVLDCRQIAAELARSTTLLSAHDHSVASRHASIEVVFEQSWHLLGTGERDALARLSLFRGGFTAEAARAVASASLPVLAALADRSLLRREGERMSLHPLVQELAGARFAGPARDKAEESHARCYLRLVAQLQRKVEDGDLATLRQVDAELENFNLAWRWAAAHGAIGALKASAWTAMHFLDHRGRVREGLGLMRIALASPAVRADGPLTALLSAAAGHLEYRLTNYPEAQAMAQAALALNDPEQDPETQLQCYKVLGSCCLWMGRLEESRRYYQQALELAPSSLDPRNAAAMLDNLSLVEKRLGNLCDAVALSLQSLEQHRQLGNTSGIALCLSNLGSKYIELDELANATAALAEALPLCERHGFVFIRGLVLANLAQVAHMKGDLEEASAFAARSLQVAETIGNRYMAAEVLLVESVVALKRADPATARVCVARSLEHALAISLVATQVMAVVRFAEILLAMGEASGARQVLAFIATHPDANAPSRQEAQAVLARLPASEAALPGWPGLALPDLVRRLVSEAPLAYGPLLAELGASGEESGTRKERKAE